MSDEVASRVRQMAAAWVRVAEVYGPDRREEFLSVQAAIASVQAAIVDACGLEQYARGAAFQERLSRNSYTHGFVTAMHVACQLHGRPVPAWVTEASVALACDEALIVRDVPRHVTGHAKGSPMH